ncbi:sensor domain-containing phosphodiesterase [Nakamurella endophytica]|uniref:EAL domain-containing protein n=1 Tax=Nakamurella endophytica TaxID=1748367 RepID=A0A917SQB5_9ACTN|nr:EAL domain-containing protein [Nakamurella endophytica]GGL93536.1 hypothetical protein GCM10011594_11730 [Nakamurella endophytica]
MRDDQVTGREGEQNAFAVRLLALARERLGMQLSWISHFTEDAFVLDAVDGELPGVQLHPGTAVGLAGSYCRRVVSGELPPVIPDAAAHPVTSALQVTRDLHIGSYVGTPLRNRAGDVYGSLCCLSSTADGRLEDRDAEFLAVLGDLLADSIEAGLAAGRNDDEARDRVRSVLDRGGPDIALQPVLRVPERVVVGYEALARFPEGTGGPQAWFALARRAGLGVELELAAVRCALPVLDRLPEDVDLAVNLSAEALLAAELPGLLAGRPVRRLIVEITEHEDVADYPALRAGMAALRGLGLRFALDDAGAGYAGMRHLVELQPDIIKMDYHLTHDMHRDPARAAMAAALVAFSARIGAVLLAEGVEDAGELEAAVDLGIGVAQGYLLGRPLPADQVVAPAAAPAAGPAGPDVARA